MPKPTTTKRLAKQASQARIVTKSVRFTFEGLDLKATISKQDHATVIYNAFYKAISTSTGLSSAIEILNDKGTKLRLGYEHLKDNGTIHVRRVQERTQGPLSTGAAGLQTQELLDKMMGNWGVEKVDGIFPDGYEHLAPREKNLDGNPATLFDDIVPVLHPRAWAGNLTGALYQLSKITKGQHQEALGALAEEVQGRNARKEDGQWGVKGVMTKDVKAATEKVRLLKTADDAVNVAYTENMVGGLQGALLEATLEGGPTFSMVERGGLDGGVGGSGV